MSVTASTLVGVGTEAFSDDLWAPPALVRPNWVGGFRVRSSFPTGVGKARSVSEQRFANFNKPEREIDFQAQGWDKEEQQLLRGLESRFGKSRQLIPLACDRALLTGQITGMTYGGDFSNRRFYVGGRVAAVVQSADKLFQNFQICTITAVTDNEITLDCELSNIPETAAAALTKFDTGTSITRTSVVIGDENEVLLVFVSSEDPTDGDRPVTSVTWGSHAMTHLHTYNEDSVDLTVSVYYITGFSGTESVTANFTGSVVSSMLAAIPMNNVNPTDPLSEAWEDLDTAIQNGITFTPTGSNCFLFCAHVIDVNDGTTGYSHTLETTFATAGARTVLQSHLLATPAEITMNHIWTGPGTRDRINLAIALHGTGDGNLAQGWLFPLVESETSLRHETVAANSEIGIWDLSAHETPGASALDPIATPGTTPSGFNTFDGDPVYEISPAWEDVRLGTIREGKRSTVGLGPTVDVYGGRVRHRLNFDHQFHTRAEAFDLLRLFDSRGGEAFSFYAYGPFADLEAISIPGGTTFTVKKVGDDFDWNWYDYITITETDGTVNFVDIVSVVRGFGEDTITVGTALPAIANDDIKRISFGIRCRFNQSAIEEGWETDEVMRTDVEIIEVLEEKSVSLTLMDICLGNTGAPWDEDPTKDSCLNRCTGITCDICGDCDVLVEWWEREVDCADTPDCSICTTLSENSEMFTSGICDSSNTIRWTQGPDWVELDTETGSWAYNISVNPPGVAQLGICACLGGQRVTESCTSFLEEEECGLESDGVTPIWVPMVRITLAAGCSN